MNSRHKKTHPKKRNQRNNAVREYCAPVLRAIKKPFVDMTLSFNNQMQAGVIGTNGYISSVPFSYFAELGLQVELYQYFEILGYQIEATLSPSIATFYEGCVAFRPINAVIGETASTSVPTGCNQIANLPGAVWLAPGARNTGKWSKATSKQVFSTRYAYASQNAGNIIFYCDNVGSIERVGDIVVRLNVRLYGEQYSIAI